MRIPAPVALGLAGLLVVAGRAPASTAPLEHTRPINADGARLIAIAVERSPTACALVEKLEGTDVVVYVHVSMGRQDGGPTAWLRFVGAQGPQRYLLVWIEAWQTGPSERISWLAHELQHACEIASAPQIRDAESLAVYYRRAGHTRGPGGTWFETGAAKVAGLVARAEAEAFRRR